MADINLTDMKDILNLNSSINAMPPELVSKFANLITIFKTVGIIFIIYIIFLIAKSIFGIIRNKRIDKMYHKINEIDEKLNLLIKKSPRILKKRLLSSQIKSNKNQKNKH
ncbi:hypothetical protein J4429_02750 [Candidatus Pacearchaeota archaeon]|nr:hypothetical protein [Candidatus Pacearchaeota archaeon]